MACPIRLPGPYEPTRQPIPRHRAVGRLLVAQRSWSGGSQRDSVKRNCATRSAPLPTGDSGQSGLSSIPCRQTHQFNVVEQLADTSVASIRSCEVPGGSASRHVAAPVADSVKAIDRRLIPRSMHGFRWDCYIANNDAVGGSSSISSPIHFISRPVPVVSGA